MSNYTIQLEGAAKDAYIAARFNTPAPAQNAGVIKMKIEQLVFNMITENTGTHMLDSGGAGGRAWQRNQGLTLEHFQNEPEATIKVCAADDECPEVDVSVFHKLTDGSLYLDDLCDEFNSIECGQWNGQYYGTDSEMSDWLDDNEFESEGDGWNTYNWGSNLSQTLQGQDLKRHGDDYILLQVHGGADVRGGYTDAKLFKVNEHCMSYEAIDDICMFSVDDDGGYVSIDWHGEWTNQDGQCATVEDFANFFKHSGGGLIAGNINQH
jgi:hypothetical protein